MQACFGAGGLYLSNQFRMVSQPTCVPASGPQLLAPAPQSAVSVSPPSQGLSREEGGRSRQEVRGGREAMVASEGGGSEATVGSEGGGMEAKIGWRTLHWRREGVQGRREGSTRV